MYPLAEQRERRYNLLQILGREISCLSGSVLSEYKGSIAPHFDHLRTLLTCKIYRDWNEMGFDTPCPIHFTKEDLEAHYKDGEGWNERAEFWDSIAGFVSREGWTSNETYDQALEMFAELRDEGLQNLTGKERVEFEEQTRWAVKKAVSAAVDSKV